MLSSIRLLNGNPQEMRISSIPEPSPNCQSRHHHVNSVLKVYILSKTTMALKYFFKFWLTIFQSTKVQKTRYFGLCVVKIDTQNNFDNSEITLTMVFIEYIKFIKWLYLFAELFFIQKMLSYFIYYYPTIYVKCAWFSCF